MNHAIESLTSGKYKGYPNLTRGPEIEIATRQELEHLKALFT